MGSTPDGERTGSRRAERPAAPMDADRSSAARAIDRVEQAARAGADKNASLPDVKHMNVRVADVTVTGGVKTREHDVRRHAP